VLLALVLAAFPGAGPARAARDVPALAGRINDGAGLIPAPARERIEATLRDLEAGTGAQVAVLTVDSLEGEPIEDYAVRVFQAWRLGRRGVDDGVLFVVARQERRMRIEVGYGLEGRLTDAVSREILDERVRPRFRAGDFGGGVEAGIDAIAAVVRGTPLPRPRRDLGQQVGSLLGQLLFVGIFGSVVGIFSLIALVAPGGVGWFLYLFLAPFYAVLPAMAFPPSAGLVAAGAWLALFPPLRLWLHGPRGKQFRKRNRLLRAIETPGGAGGGGGWRWSSGGSSSGGGGGGFSGGGGSSGGGGASSSW
jgi:uncharacterized protein